jgi:MFS family permease
MDGLSTWMATPNLVLEGNPIAKLLGWRWGIPVNAVFCLALAFWPLPAIILSTTSILVAARNFQSAWLMRSLGEEAYREWHVQRIQETRITIFLLSLAGNTVLTAVVGAAVIYCSGRLVVPFGIGVGIVAYAGAVAFYTVLALVRLRRNELRQEERKARFAQAAVLSPPQTLAGIEPQGK